MISHCRLDCIHRFCVNTGMWSAQFNKCESNDKLVSWFTKPACIIYLLADYVVRAYFPNCGLCISHWRKLQSSNDGSTGRNCCYRHAFVKGRSTRFLFQCIFLHDNRYYISFLVMFCTFKIGSSCIPCFRNLSLLYKRFASNNVCNKIAYML